MNISKDFYILNLYDFDDRLLFFQFNDYKPPLFIFFHISETAPIRAPICIKINNKFY